MKKRYSLSLVICSLGACGPDETISGYAETDTSYNLSEIDKAPFVTTASIVFGKDGTVSGKGPCNTFSASQSAPYPWFALGPIASTRKACPHLQLETVYFEALADMSIAEVVGGTLILSNDAGREMVFQAE